MSAARRGRVVCRLSELAPGRMRCIDLDGRAVLIANVGGEILATDDTCTHEDASLSSGVLDGAHVRCPLHGSRFDLRTGQPLEEPAEEPLVCHTARVENGHIVIVLGPDDT